MAVVNVYRAPELLKLLLASSTSFQTWVGAADETEAQGYIRKWYGVAPTKPPPDVTILGLDEGSSVSRSKISTKLWQPEATFITNWRVLVARNSSDYEVEGDECYNIVTDILEECEDIIDNNKLVGGENPGRFVEMAPVGGPSRQPDQERDPQTTGSQEMALWTMQVSFELGS